MEPPAVCYVYIYRENTYQHMIRFLSEHHKAIIIEFYLKWRMEMLKYIQIFPISDYLYEKIQGPDNLNLDKLNSVIKCFFLVSI